MSMWIFGMARLLFIGSSVQGIFQARVMEWVAISFSRASS